MERGTVTTDVHICPLQASQLVWTRAEAPFAEIISDGQPKRVPF